MESFSQFLKLYLLMSLSLLSCTEHRDDQPDPVVTDTEVLLPGGEFEMGDHFGFVDPAHPTDELPIHMVKVNSFYIGITETTNSQFLEFLNR